MTAARGVAQRGSRSFAIPRMKGDARLFEQQFYYSRVTTGRGNVEWRIAGAVLVSSTTVCTLSEKEFYGFKVSSQTGASQSRVTVGVDVRAQLEQSKDSFSLTGCSRLNQFFIVVHRSLALGMDCNC